MALAPATPQPSKSTSNYRSTRVIEELQETWDTLQKDLITTKTQLDTALEAKKNNEQQSKDYVQSNQECRAQIQELMKLLEDKQQSLDVTKQQSVALENKVKQLKDEAMISRKHLDDLKKRETQLGQDRDAAVLAKACVEQQQKILEQSVLDLDHRSTKEQQQLEKELDTLKHQLDQVSSRNQWMADMMVSVMDDETRTRREWIQQMHTQHQQQRQTTKLFIEKIQLELQSLLEQVNSLGGGDSHSNNTLDLDVEVKQCQDEINGLVQKIQSYSLILQ
ncbi:hypothetical protein BC941DRAFT_381313 [Chlamydoabsidia padenii]|nr:hypothetical protein BC941DRAFT_381313 [Chlamydoabsidia padenii]